MKAIIAGVYFLFDGKEIVYVGQSADIFRRIYEHSSGRAKGEKKKFDTWEYFEISDEAERLRAEHLLILALKPKYNIDYSGANARSVDGRTENEKENEKRVNKIKWFVNEFERIANSISVYDMDHFFGFPRGTFTKLITEKSIPEEDYYYGTLSVFDCRIKFDAAYEMAQNLLRSKFGNDNS